MQTVTTAVGSEAWALAALFAFVAVYLLTTVRLVQARVEELEAHAVGARPDASWPRDRQDGSFTAAR